MAAITKIQPKSGPLARRSLKASQALRDYEYWLIRNYGKAGTYLVNAKTFLKTYKTGGTLLSQLDSYMAKKKPALRSILRRFRGFVVLKEIHFLSNDLNEKRIPKGNIYVRLYLAHQQDRLRGDLSSSTYATVLNHFFNEIDHNLLRFNKRNAEKFVLAAGISDYTKRLYKSVLRSFCQWVLLYQGVPDRELNKEEKIVKRGLKRISAHSLREISSIHVRSSRIQMKSYHKGSLTKIQRNKLLKLCNNQRERTIVSLMAWNGLRTIEVIRMSASDPLLRSNKLMVWSKGKSSRTKDTIKLFALPKRELHKYIKLTKIRKGRLFPRLTKKEIEDMIRAKFRKLRLHRRNEKFSPHSLRHTAGQIMYDKGVRLEFVQKTLRHSVLDTTLVYAQRAIDRSYFRIMPTRI